MRTGAVALATVVEWWAVIGDVHADALSRFDVLTDDRLALLMRLTLVQGRTALRAI
jgi:hypothetical protein